MTTTNTTNVVDITTLNAKPLAGFVMFIPWVSSYTGSKKLTPEVLGLRKEDLPPATLASLGAMHTCDPQSLQPYESARNAQRKACLKWGVQTRFGFAVVRDKALEVDAELKDIKAKFYAYKATHLPRFEAEREEWIAKPEFALWTDRIRARLHSKAYLERQIQCDCEVFEIAPAADLPVDPSTGESIGVGTAGIASSIGDLALDEISTDANYIREQSLEKDGVQRLEVTQKILRPIIRIRDKSLALSFAAPVMNRIVDHINFCLGKLPQKGKMVDDDLATIVQLVHSLCDAKGLVKSLTFVKGQAADVEDDDFQQVLLDARGPAPVDAPVDLTPVEDDLGGSSATATDHPVTEDANQELALVHDDV